MLKQTKKMNQVDQEQKNTVDWFSVFCKIGRIVFFVGVILVVVYSFVLTEMDKANISVDSSAPLKTQIKSAVVQDVVNSSIPDASDKDKSDVQEVIDKYTTSEILNDAWEYIQNDDEEGLMQYLSDTISEDDLEVLSDIFGSKQ